MNPKLPDLEPEFFTLFQLTPDLVCVADKAGFFKLVNEAVVEKLGYTRDELFSKPISSFIHPEDKELTGHRRNELLTGKALINFQNRYVAKNGKIVWLHWTSIYFPDKEMVFAIAKDITKTKLNEAAIEEKYRKYRSLASHFKTSIEKDRKFIALELHEELAQLAAVVKMDIHWLKDHLPVLSGPSKSRMDNALTVSGLLVNGLRKITYSISPNMLEDLGLHDTLEWLCEDFSLLNGIRCLYHNNYKVETLPHEIQLDFFRICQEALSNITLHARASMVKVNIRPVKDKVYLSIVDDGVGFDPDQVKNLSGITDMQTRATSINGHLTVHSAPGKGTQVCLSIPQLLDYD